MAVEMFRKLPLLAGFLALIAPFWLGSCKPPTKPVTIICPWAPGGGTDRVSRFFADQLESTLGRPGVVQNRTGGGGAVGHSAGANARPDGNTITMGTFELSTMHWMRISELTYKDFHPIIQVNADAAALIVRQDASWQTLTDLINAIKAEPGDLKMSGTASGGAWDLARAGFQLAAGIPVKDVLWIPTDGSAPSLVELLGEHIDVVCCSLPEAASQIQSGQLRALTVMADERVPEFPDIPTAKEAGIDWSAVGWRGLLLPKDTPADIAAQVSEAVTKIAKSRAYADFLKKNGFGLVIREGEAFRKFLAEQDAQWQKVIQTAGFAK